MPVIFEFNIGEIARGVEVGKFVDVGVDPEGRWWWESVVLSSGIVAGDLLADAVDLIDIDMGVVGDESEKARAGADALGDQMTEHGILGNVKWQAKRNVGRAGGD